jgi:hypothetical protein
VSVSIPVAVGGSACHAGALACGSMDDVTSHALNLLLKSSARTAFTLRAFHALWQELPYTAYQQNRPIQCVGFGRAESIG